MPWQRYSDKLTATLDYQDTLVPRGRKDVDGTVLSATTDVKNNAYVIEYTITSSGIKRHLLTVFSLQPGRYVNTLTAQAREENWSVREKVMRDVVASFVSKPLD